MTREQAIQSLRQNPVDLLVIGGGITGAGIALDAASRGLAVALVEKDDFAYGTSSRSTKLIHGGLRYLKQLEFALVKEVGSERAIVHRLAPHLVVPEKMLLPLYEKRGLGYWLTSIGLKVYDWLAGVKAEDQRKMLTKQQTLAQEPLLKSRDVKGGALYAEYRTDDARLTIEIIKLAASFGATVVNYAEATGFGYREGKVASVSVLDRQTHQSFEVKATAVVNAAGPWVDEIRQLNQSKQGKTLHLTKGVHIVLPYHRLPVRQAIYFDVPDGRMIFAIPRGRVTYVGTTDTDYTSDKGHVFTSKEDALYLVHAINETFPTVHITLADIESSWAGLRPLIHEEGKSASELSRKDEIFESPSGLISIAGGKLTGYRKMAERVVDRVLATYFSGNTYRPCHTDQLPLAGHGLKQVSEVQALESKLTLRFGQYGLLGSDITNLVHLYGAQATQIFEAFERHRSDDAERDLLRAEMAYAIDHEFAVSPLDFLIRRSGMLYFNRPRAVHYRQYLLDFFAVRFQWTADERVMQENKMTLAMDEVIQCRL
mgnify:CR=1 FL=1